MNLKALLSRLKLSIQARDWKEIMRALGQLLIGGADLAEMFDGGAAAKAKTAIAGDEVGADLTEMVGLLTTLQAETAAMPATVEPKAVDPVKLVALLKLVLEMVAEWRARK